MATGIRRAGGAYHAAAGVPRGICPRRCAVHQRELRGTYARRADADRRRHQCTALLSSSPHPEGRVGVVSGLLRTRSGFRSRLVANPRCARGRRIHRERAEDLEHASPSCRLLRAAGAHRARCAEAQGHQLADHADDAARHRGATDTCPRRIEPLLRDVPRRGAGTGGQSGGQGARRVAGRQRDAEVRARHGVRGAHHHDARPDP